MAYRGAQHSHPFLSALQKRQASENEECVARMEEQHQTFSIFQVNAEMKQQEEQVAAMRSEVESGRTDITLAILGRLERIQDKGVEICSSTCFVIMLRASIKS